MVKSLKSEILERLDLRKGGRGVASKNIETATKDFATSSAPQFRGKSKAKRHQMAVAAGLSAARGESIEPKKGDKFIYEGKQVVVDSYNARSGLVVVRRNRQKEIMVRAADLKPAQLNEAIMGLGQIAPTYVDRPQMSKMPALTMADIGLYEDDFTGEKDEQEEDHDNGSNVRHDGHTNEKEVDELPTPSDTIAPAYSDEKSPKQISDPLSTHVGAEPGKLWQEPDWDGYDYPADAPEIPQADFLGDQSGNARPPECGDGHDAGDGQEEAREDADEDSKRTDETYMGFNKLEKKLSRKSGIKNPGAIAASIGRKKYGKKKFQSAAAHHHKMHEAYKLIAEMGDMLGKGEDREPHESDSISVTLPAMAAIVCTVAHRMGADVQEGGEDHTLLRSMVEALAEIGHGKTLDVDDLQAVAAHMNGEETQEVENRDEGHPDHQGMDDQDDAHPADKWPGDGEKSGTGKTKMMDATVSEASNDFYGIDDILAEMQMTEEEELRLIKKRAGLKYW